MLAERRVVARELRFIELAANLHFLRRHQQQQAQAAAATAAIRIFDKNTAKLNPVCFSIVLISRP